MSVWLFGAKYRGCRSQAGYSEALWSVGGGSCPKRGVTAHLDLPRCSCHCGSYGERTCPELVLESSTHPQGCL